MLLSDPCLLKDRCLIGDPWVGTPTLEVKNPATGALTGRVPIWGKRDAGGHRRGQRSLPRLERELAKERAAILRRWYQLQRDHKEHLALVMTSGQGKPLAEARSEVDYAASFTEFFADKVKRIHGEILPTPKEGSKLLVLKRSFPLSLPRSAALRN